MIAKGQSKKAKAARVSLGRCPIHGLPMYQETPYLSAEDAGKFRFSGPEDAVCLVRCPRKHAEHMHWHADQSRS